MIFLRNDNNRTYFKSTIETFSKVKRKAISKWPTSADIMYNKLVVLYIYFSIHYENMTMQYAVIFTAAKIDNFQLKFF